MVEAPGFFENKTNVISVFVWARSNLKTIFKDSLMTTPMQQTV
jgi:hypothetical protein